MEIGRSGLQMGGDRVERRYKWVIDSLKIGRDGLDLWLKR